MTAQSKKTFARRMRTAEELVGHVSIWQTKFWERRKLSRKLKVLDSSLHHAQQKLDASVGRPTMDGWVENQLATIKLLKKLIKKTQRELKDLA